jgi:MFS family permease
LLVHLRGDFPFPSVPSVKAITVRFIVALALFNMTSVRAGRVLLTLYTIRLEGGPLAVGMLAASFSVIPVLFSWMSGRWVDRFGSRWLLLIGVGGSAGGMLLPFFMPSLTTVLLAGTLSGLSMTFCNVSLQNLVGQISSPQQRAKNFSNYSLAGALSSFVGPMIAGFSIDHLGHHSTCLTVLGLAMIPLGMLGIRGSTLPRGSGKAEHAGTLWNIFSAPGIGRVLIVSSIAQIANDLFQFYMPVYAHDAGLSASAIGIVLAMYAAASFVVRFVLPRLIAKSSEDKVLAVAFGMAAAAFLLVPFVHHGAMLALMSFLLGLGMGCTSPITMMLMYASSPPGRSAEAMGLRQTIENLTRLFGPVLFGMMAASVGLASVFWLNAVMLGSGGLFARKRARTHRKS